MPVAAKPFFYRDHNPPPDDDEFDLPELEDGEAWCPEPANITSLDDGFTQEYRRIQIPSILPSQFTEFAFRMPSEDGLGYVPFSFKGRRHMRRPYDTPARRILLSTARQVEKSTLLGNKAITYSCMVDGYRTLYVSPSATQTKTFSADRIKDPLETSHILKSFTLRALQQNVFEKQFINRSKITLRYAFLNADRCAVGGTRVHFVDGSVATLEEIFSDRAAFLGKWVWSANSASLGVVPARLSDVIDQGIRPVVRVGLERGVEVVCTTNQPLLTGAGWRPIEQLKVGQLVAVPRRVAHGIGNAIPIEEYRLVGYLLGDGGVTTFTNASFFSGCPRVLREFRRCATVLGAQLRKIQDSNPKKWVHSKTRQQPLGGGASGYKKRLVELGIIGKHHFNKRVPREFFSGNEEQVKNFLGAIYATDGWASSKKGQFEVGYCSNSHGLLEDLQVLLLRFGISGYISKRKKPSTKNALGAFTLSIRSAPSVLSFCAAIPVLGKESAFRGVLRGALRVRRIKDDADRVSLSYAALRLYLLRAHGLSTHAAWMQHRIQLRPGNIKDSIGRRVLRQISEKLDDMYLRTLADSELGWARIQEIRAEEPQRTYDLTIDTTENYLVDGVFIHNTRGIPASALLIDEFQDILGDNIPIIEQCTSHAPEKWKRFIYAGTPKSLDNIMEYYRGNLSTQGEWVVPCDRHGGEGGRYWNILGERNIGKKGLVCEKCNGLIDSAHPDAQWAQMVKKATFESYRIPQLMVPWKPWDEILIDYERYPRDKFYNEVLGISYDSGHRPLTRAQIIDCCHPDVTMHPKVLEQYRALSYGQPIFAGLDWGSGENSYTVLSLGVYIENKFRIFYIHRFVGEDVAPDEQLTKIEKMLADFNVRVIGCDYGGGFHSNDRLIRKFGAQRVQKYQYLARCKKKVEFDPKLRRWKVFRTEVMSDIFNAIKRQQIEFPNWGEFEKPYGQDMLNIFAEYNETLRMIQYSHGPDKPDDALHSVLYCFLGSMILQPRPDIIAPTREDGTRGPLQGMYSGTIDQG